MTDKKKKSKIRKALGQDPFADLEGLEQITDLPPEKEGGKDDIKTEPTPTEAEAEVEVEVETEAEFETEGEMEGDFLDDLIAQAEVDLAVESDTTLDAAETETEAEFELEGGFLDDLIAGIDDEIEQAFGLGSIDDVTGAAPVSATGETQYVIFTMTGTEYAAPIHNVIEIGRPLRVTPVPNVANWVLGVANLRGDIISMVDLQLFFGLEAAGYSGAGRMLIARSRQEDMTIGLIVDRVNEIRYLSTAQITAPAAPIEDQVSVCLQGVYEYEERLLVVLDFERLFLLLDMQQLQPV